MARKIVGDQVELADRVCLGDRFEQPQVAFGIARRGAERESFAVAYPQRAVDPDFLGTPAVLQGCLDAVSVRRPARRGRIGAGLTGPSSSRQTTVEFGGGLV